MRAANIAFAEGCAAIIWWNVDYFWCMSEGDLNNYYYYIKLMRKRKYKGYNEPKGGKMIGK